MGFFSGTIARLLKMGRRGVAHVKLDAAEVHVFTEGSIVY